MSNSYKEAFKGFTIFGSTQLLTIAILLIKTKLIAIYLGAEGIGIHSILTTNINLLCALFGLGIYSAAISVFSDKSNFYKIYKELFSVVFFFSCIGVLLTIIFSSLLSDFLFNDISFQNEIIIVSFIIIITNLTNLKKSALQSLGYRKRISIASVFASLLSLTTIFFYVYFGKKGIALALLFSSIFSLISYYSQKPFITKIQISNIYRNLKTHKPTIFLGISMVFGGVLFNFFANILNVLIVQKEGLIELGKFQSALSITNQATALIFTAVTLDYYPRLSNAANDVKTQLKIVNNQISLILFLIVPTICIMMVFIRPIINLLLTKEFLSISILASLMLFSTIFKGMQICLGYILLSKGEGKKYFIVETVGIVFFFIFCFLFYHFFGLIGLGYAYIFGNIFYLIIYIFATSEISLNAIDSEYLKHFFIFSSSVFFLLICQFYYDNYFFFISKFIVLLFILSYSFRELNKKLNLIKVFKIFMKRNPK